MLVWASIRQQMDSDRTHLRSDAQSDGFREPLREVRSGRAEVCFVFVRRPHDGGRHYFRYLPAGFVGAVVAHLRVGDVKGMGSAALILILCVAALALRVMKH